MNAPVQSVSSATPTPRTSDSSIGGLLLESGKITPENAERVLRMQKSWVYVLVRPHSVSV
jgi:hypothetical protein